MYKRKGEGSGNLQQGDGFFSGTTTNTLYLYIQTVFLYGAVSHRHVEERDEPRVEPTPLGHSNSYFSSSLTHRAHQNTKIVVYSV